MILPVAQNCPVYKTPTFIKKLPKVHWPQTQYGVDLPFLAPPNDHAQNLPNYNIKAHFTFNPLVSGRKEKHQYVSPTKQHKTISRRAVFRALFNSALYASRSSPTKLMKHPRTVDAYVARSTSLNKYIQTHRFERVEVVPLVSFPSTGNVPDVSIGQFRPRVISIEGFFKTKEYMYVQKNVNITAVSKFMNMSDVTMQTERVIPLAILRAIPVVEGMAIQNRMKEKMRDPCIREWLRKPLVSQGGIQVDSTKEFFSIIHKYRAMTVEHLNLVNKTKGLIKKVRRSDGRITYAKQRKYTVEKIAPTGQRCCNTCDVILCESKFQKENRFRCLQCKVAEDRRKLKERHTLNPFYAEGDRARGRAQGDAQLFGLHKIRIRSSECREYYMRNRLQGKGKWYILPRDPTKYLTLLNSCIVSKAAHTFLLKQWRCTRDVREYMVALGDILECENFDPGNGEVHNSKQPELTLAPCI